MDSASTSLTLQIAYGLVFLLLVSITGGIVYLTVVDWKDKRLRKQSEGASAPRKATKAKPAKAKAATKASKSKSSKS